MNIKTNRRNFLIKPLEELDENKIIFYDIETDHQFAAYAKLRTIAWQEGIRGKPEMVLGSFAHKRFREKISDPSVIKVDFNGVNFDRIVCARHGLAIHPQNAHDLFLVFKTIAPNLPSFSLKFLSFYYLSDPHFPQMRMEQWMAEKGVGWDKVPARLLNPYNKHDVVQTVNLFRLAWDIVIRPEFWKSYMHDLMMGEPLLEMETQGGIYLDRNGCSYQLHRLQKVVQAETKRALELTGGQVQNANSSPQLGRYFSEIDGLQLELSDDGNFKVDKAVLMALKSENALADCAFNIREANAEMKYFENYLNALDDETYPKTRTKAWIPVQFSVSSARTRRFTSQSLYRLNFQNPSEAADEVQVVPPGFLGWWFDATQVENIVHIYESQDWQRRKAYEDDPNWNEYVWLCNMTYGVERTKDEWDDKSLYPSTVVPHWSIYKEKKSVKLGMNFGLGVKKYCKMNGLSPDVGQALYHDVHEACPSIHELQNRVARDLRTTGFVTDSFGYRYAGSSEKAYKVVAYLIQGCGTSALPKVQIRTNWETLRRFDSRMPFAIKRTTKCGVMATTTHDENGGYIDLRLGDENILQLLQKLNHNMTVKFSHKFDDIPLRAKLYLSKTTAGKAIEVAISDHANILKIIRGSACPMCQASGRIGEEKCRTCKGIGYV